MSRIDATFAALRAANRRALIPFITAGDPEPGLTVPLMHALVEGGADILELGVPFSDPMADGPTIQRASERALAWGMSLSTVLALVHQFRRTDSKTPVVLMGYANPIEAFGQEAFAQAAQQAGVDGVLVVDYPPEECREFSECMKRAGIDPIFLLAPTSSERRFDDVAQAGRGYLYYVSLKGVTGSGALDLDEVTARIPHIRARVGLPVGVGFGIRDAQTAARIAQVADAVVIGSRLIEEIETAPREEVIQRVRDFIHNIRRALDDAALPVLETPT